MKQQRIILFCLLVLFYCSIQAQQLKPEPAYKNFTVDHGLPSNETYAVFEDSLGFIWIATDRGVSRYDGYKFENFTTEDGLPDNTIFDFEADQHSRIWFKTFNGKMGYYHLLSKKFHILKNLDFGCRLLQLEIDSTERFSVWCSKGLYSFDMNSQFDTTSYLNFLSKATREKYQIEDSNMLIELINYSHLFSGISSNQLSLSLNGYTLVCRNSTLVIFDKEFRLVKSLMLPDGPSHFQIADSAIIVFFNNKQVIKYSVPNLTPSKTEEKKYVLSYRIMDRSGNRWESTLDNGILCYPNPDCKIWNKDKAIICIGDWKNQIVYASNSRDMYLNHAKVAHTKNKVRQFEKLDTTKLYYIDKMLYINHVKIHVPSQYASNTFYVDKDTIWFANRRLIAKGHVEGKKWKMDWEIKVPKHRIEKVKRSKDLFWIATIKGLAWFDTKKKTFRYFDSPTRNDSLLRTRITDLEISINNDSLLFLATRGAGVLIKKGPQLMQIDNEHGLLTNLTNALYNQGDSTLWIATNMGLSKVSLTGTYPYDYSIENYTKAEGLSTNNVNDVYLLNDSVFLATKKGINSFPVGMKTKSTPPIIYISGIQINRTDTIVKNNYELSFDQNTIKIDFLALTFSEAGLTKYRYRLLGADSTWYEQSAPTIQFLRLSPGNYTFEIVAVNHNGITSLEPVRIQFSIAKPLLLRWYFILIYISCIVFILYLIVRFRFNLIRRNESNKRQLVEMELKALRSQMNPHFTFNTLNSIQSFINTKNTDDAVDYIAKFAELMRMILENSSEEFIELAREIRALNRYLEIEQLRFDNKFDFEIIIDKTIDIYFEKIPSMILQPYIENAIWHGLQSKDKKGEIRIEVESTENGLRCIVDDNGIGRSKAKELKQSRDRDRRSFGMLITSERLEILNQNRNKEMTVRIIDKEDDEGNSTGTRVELTILD